jgi:hypothetical protein
VPREKGAVRKMVLLNPASAISPWALCNDNDEEKQQAVSVKANHLISVNLGTPVAT